VEDVKKHVLGQVALLEETRGPIAEDSNLTLVDDRSPGRHEFIRELFHIDATRSSEIGKRVVVVVEVCLQVATPQPEGVLERFLVEWNPVSKGPALGRQPLMRRSRRRKAVVGDGRRRGSACRQHDRRDEPTGPGAHPLNST
jgi:hypothetical protein